MAEHIRIEIDPRGVASLWLDRPQKHNAMNAQMIAELAEAAARLGADRDVRVVVLRGEGKTFCAGGDLEWMQAQMAADGPQRARHAEALAEMLYALDRLPKPLIAAVSGNALGGGVGLISVADLAIGADDIRLGLSEVRLGLIPATIGPYVIARMGPAKARQVFFSGRLFHADEAVSLGLLARAVPRAALDAEVEAEVAPYLLAAPGAVAEAKSLIRVVSPSVTRAEIEASVAALVRRWESPEAEEGIRAFFEKRPANFVHKP